MPSVPPWRSYIRAESVHDTVARVRRAGGSVVVEPLDLPDAAREAVVSDQVGQSSACGSKARTRVPGSLTSRVHGAAVFCAPELLVENYAKDLANSNRSTPLAESRARNLSSPAFVVW